MPKPGVWWNPLRLTLLFSSTLFFGKLCFLQKMEISFILSKNVFFADRLSKFAKFKFLFLCGISSRFSSAIWEPIFENSKWSLGLSLYAIIYLGRSHRILTKFRFPESWDWELSNGEKLSKSDAIWWGKRPAESRGYFWKMFCKILDI